MKKYRVFCTVACNNNPGKCGFASALQDENGQTLSGHSGSIRHTSYNRTIVVSLLGALKNVTEPSEVEITSDSFYLINGLQRLEQWVNASFKTKSGRVQNQDLWNHVRTALQPHQITLHLVDKRNPHPEVDRLRKFAEETCRSGKLFRDEFFEKEHGGFAGTASPPVDEKPAEAQPQSASGPENATITV